MTNNSSPGIFLIVEFDWPSPTPPALFQAAASLHKTLERSIWMQEILGGFGGIGSHYQSIWIFKFSNFADIDILLENGNEREEVEAYSAFFDNMKNVKTIIKQEVTFE